MNKGLLPALISGLVFASTATGNPQSIEGIDSFLENDIEDLIKVNR